MLIITAMTYAIVFVLQSLLQNVWMCQDAKYVQLLLLLPAAHSPPTLRLVDHTPDDSHTPLITWHLYQRRAIH